MNNVPAWKVGSIGLMVVGCGIATAALICLAIQPEGRPIVASFVAGYLLLSACFACWDQTKKGRGQ